MKILFSLLLLLSVSAHASNQFYCQELYEAKAKEDLRKSDLINENFDQIQIATLLTFTLGGAPGVVFAVGSYLGSGTYAIVKRVAHHNNIIFQSAMAEAQIGREATIDQIKSMIDTDGLAIDSPIDYMVLLINEKSKKNKVTYDQVASNLRAGMYDETFCPNGKTLRFRKIKKILSK